MHGLRWLYRRFPDKLYYGVFMYMYIMCVNASSIGIVARYVGIRSVSLLKQKVPKGTFEGSKALSLGSTREGCHLEPHVGLLGTEWHPVRKVPSGTLQASLRVP